jgi:rRNA-processing protein FCF1
MKKATAKSLAKTAVLDASDNPDDQDEARKRRVKMDFASWRKQTKSGKTTHQEEVGISSAAAMEKARKEAELKAKEEAAVKKKKVEESKKSCPEGQYYCFDEKECRPIPKGHKVREDGELVKEAKVDQGLDDEAKEDARNYRKFGTKHNQAGTARFRRALHRSRRGDKKVKGAKEVQVEAKVDTGKSADEKAIARNQRNTPPGADKTIDLKTFITRKPGESLESARRRVRQGQHAARRGVKEEVELQERPLDTFEKAEKERVVKGMKKDTAGFKERYGKDWKNVMYATATKKAKEAYAYEEVELSEQWVDSAIDISTDYFFYEGLNSEGVELVIEEVGLDDFVEFVLDPIEELNEERPARKAKVSAPSYEKVKAAVDKADKAKKESGKGEYAKSYAKRSGETEDSTNYDDKAPVKKPPAKKPPAKKVTVRKVTPTKKAATKKKVTASVAKAKTKQPLKPTSKKGIRGAIERGVARHKAAVGKAKKEVGKVVKTAKATAKQHSQHRKDFVKGITPTSKEKKIAKGVGKVVKKALTREELELLEARDRAFDNVVAKLRAQHGKDSVITKDNPLKPPTEAQKKAYAAHKAKIAKQDTRDDLEKSSQGRYSRKYSNVGSD